MSDTTKTAPSASPEQKPKQDAASGCLVRIYWMILGNALVVLGAYQVAQSGALFTGADIFYWLMVAALIAARYADIRYFHGAKGDGTPATLAHWKRYALVVVAIAAVFWVAVHTVLAVVGG